MENFFIREEYYYNFITKKVIVCSIVFEDIVYKTLESFKFISF